MEKIRSGWFVYNMRPINRNEIPSGVPIQEKSTVVTGFRSEGNTILWRANHPLRVRISWKRVGPVPGIKRAIFLQVLGSI